MSMFFPLIAIKKVLLKPFFVFELLKNRKEGFLKVKEEKSLVLNRKIILCILRYLIQCSLLIDN